MNSQSNQCQQALKLLTLTDCNLAGNKAIVCFFVFFRCRWERLCLLCVYLWQLSPAVTLRIRGFICLFQPGWWGDDRYHQLLGAGRSSLAPWGLSGAHSDGLGLVAPLQHACTAVTERQNWERLDGRSLSSKHLQQCTASNAHCPLTSCHTLILPALYSEWGRFRGVCQVIKDPNKS